MELGFWIPILSGIPDFLSYILDSKAQDSEFYKQNFLEFWILEAKISQIQESWFRNTRGDIASSKQTTENKE